MNISLKRIAINNINFVVQAHLKDELTNICCSEIASIRIDWRTNQIGSWGKQCDKWKAFVSSLDLNDVKKAIDKIFEQ